MMYVYHMTYHMMLHVMLLVVIMINNFNSLKCKSNTFITLLWRNFLIILFAFVHECVKYWISLIITLHLL